MDGKRKPKPITTEEILANKAAAEELKQKYLRMMEQRAQRG